LRRPSALSKQEEMAARGQYDSVQDIFEQAFVDITVAAEKEILSCGSERQAVHSVAGTSVKYRDGSLMD
jgi:hypothetical protein